MKNIINYITQVNESELDQLVSLENEVMFWSISKRFSGYGHYEIELELNIDGKEVVLRRTTSNMPLIDAWTEQVNGGEWDEDYENPIFTAIQFVYDEDEIREKLSG